MWCLKTIVISVIAALGELAMINCKHNADILTYNKVTLLPISFLNI